MSTKPKKLKTDEPGFWPTWAAKLMFTLISVKIWGLVAGTAISTWLLMINLHNQPVVTGGKVYEFGINGAQWLTFNTTIWALIFGMKEIFRISESRDEADKSTLKTQVESKIAMERIRKSANDNSPEYGSTTDGKYEIMSDEPPQKP